MKKILLYLAVMMPLMVFNGCKSDDETGFDISGLYGITWRVDLGETNSWGDYYYSEFTFNHGKSTRYGTGREFRYNADNLRERGETASFDWEVRTNNLYLDYENDFTLIFTNLYISPNKDYFTANVRWNDGSRQRVKFYYVGGSAKEDIDINDIK